MKNLKKIFPTLLTIFFITGFLFSVAGCKNSDDDNGDSSNSKQPATTSEIDKYIFTFFPPDALGDVFYYDKISYGVHSAALKNNIRCFDIVPEDWDDGKTELQSMFEIEDRDYTILIILADPGYLPFLKDIEQPKLKQHKILLLESREIENQAVSTVFLPLYGVSYLAGVLAKEQSVYTVPLEKVRSLCLLANDKNSIMNDGLEGFAAGFHATYDKIYTMFDEGSEEEESAKNLNLLAMKLSESEASDGIDTSSGFNNASDAYRITRLLQNSSSPFNIYFPLCGASAQGVLKFSREQRAEPFFVIGMNDDMSPYSKQVPFSVVKHIDKAIEKCVTQWISEKEIPHYQEFGLKDGWTELVLSENYSSSAEKFKSIIQEAMETALSKEREYEDSHKN